MTGQEIKQNIEELEEKIEKVTNGELFVLNQIAFTYQKEIERLQKLCEHEFDSEKNCIYCHSHKQ